MPSRSSSVLLFPFRCTAGSDRFLLGWRASDRVEREHWPGEAVKHASAQESFSLQVYWLVSHNRLALLREVAFTHACETYRLTPRTRAYIQPGGSARESTVSRSSLGERVLEWGSTIAA